MLAAPFIILTLVLCVPIAYRYLWPVKVGRPKLFLMIMLTTGLVVAGIAIFWFFSVLNGAGVASRSPTAASSAAFESVLRNRLLVAAVLGAVVEYLLCRITHTIMGAQR